MRYRKLASRLPALAVASSPSVAAHADRRRPRALTHAGSRHQHVRPANVAMALTYDRVMGDRMHPVLRRSFDSIVARYRIEASRVADIGCGTGTFLRYLAGMGCTGYGVDRDPAMLAIAARKLRGRPIRLLQQDMQHVRLPQTVDLVTCNYDTLNYLLSEHALGRTIAAFARALDPRGHLLFDLLTGDGDAPRGEIVQRIRLPDVSTDWRVRCDPSRRSSIVDIRSVVHPPGGARWVERERHRQRWFPLATVTRLLDRAGLKLMAAYRFGTAERAGPETYWVQCLARPS
jgi:SAM-dependent methyltransferase